MILAGSTLCSILNLLPAWGKVAINVWPPQLPASTQRQGPCLALSGAIVLGPSPGLAGRENAPNVEREER